MVKLYVQVYKCKVIYKLIETSKTRGDCRELKLSKSPHILLIIELGKRRGKHKINQNVPMSCIKNHLSNLSLIKVRTDSSTLYTYSCNNNELTKKLICGYLQKDKNSSMQFDI